MVVRLPVRLRVGSSLDSPRNRGFHTADSKAKNTPTSSSLSTRFCNELLKCFDSASRSLDAQSPLSISLTQQRALRNCRLQSVTALRCSCNWATCSATDRDRVLNDLSFGLLRSSSLVVLCSWLTRVNQQPQLSGLLSYFV